MNREIKDALRLAKKTRRGYAIGGNPTDPVAGTNPALIAAQPTPLQTSNRLDPSQQYAANLASAGFNQSQIDAMLKSQSAPAQPPAPTPASPFTMAPTSVAAAPVKQSISPQTTATTPVSTAAPASATPATQSFNVPDYRATFVQNALGRSITPEENTQWQNYINSNQLTDDQIQNSILNSPEATTNYRASFVNDILGRQITPQEQQQWQNYISSNQLSNDQVQDAILHSPEAINNSRAAFVQNTLGRQITPEEQKNWEQYVNSGQGTDADIENYIQNSDEAANNEHTQFLKDEYTGLMGREPTPDEIAYVVPKLRSGEITQEQFDNYLSNTDASQQYQASNFEPYQEASNAAGGVRKQLRTAFQISQDNVNKVKNLPLWRQLAILGMQEGEAAAARDTQTNRDFLAQIMHTPITRAGAEYQENGGKKYWQTHDPRDPSAQIHARAAFSAMNTPGKKEALRGNKLINDYLKNPDDPRFKVVNDVAKGVVEGTVKNPTPNQIRYRADYVRPSWINEKGSRVIAGPTPSVGSKHIGYGSVKYDNKIKENLPGVLTKINSSSKETPQSTTPQDTETPIGQTGGGGFTPQPGQSPYDPVTEQFLREHGIGVPQEGGTEMSGFTDLSTGKVYDKPIDVGGPGGGQGASNDTGGSFDVADNGGSVWDGAGWVSGWADQAPQGPSTDNGYSTWGPWSEDYYTYEPDMLGQKRGGRVTRGLEIAKRADGGRAVEDALRLADPFAKGGPVWNKPRPKSLGKPKPLSSKQKSKAKAAAKAAGRPYPNLIDNMRAAKGK